MLDQKKTGMFINDMRKEKGLTQKQLADELGVSDKTISKWENGRGMPDTSLMVDLCSVLGININELLSGERLSEDAYNGKAEDNMVKLIKDNENARRDGAGSALGTIIGIILLCLYIYAIAFISGGSEQIIWFLDAPSLLVVVGILLITLGTSGHFSRFFRSFKLIFSSKQYSPEELQNLSEKSEYTVGLAIRVALLSGALGSLIGIIIMLHILSDPASIAPSISVALLTLFFATLIALFLCVIKGKLHKLSEG